MMPPFHDEYVRPLVKAFLHGVAFLVKFQGFDPNPPGSIGNDDLLVLFRNLTNERLSPYTSGIKRYVGWVFSPSSPVRLSVCTGSGVSAHAVIKNMPSPDVCEVFKSRGIDTTYAHEARFEITARDCGKDCCLEVESPDGRLIKRIDLDGRGPPLDGPELFFNLDSRTGNRSPAGILPNRELWDRKKVRVLSCIGKIYQVLVPVMFIPALAVYALTAIQVFRKRKNAAIFLANTALLMIIIARVLILGIIEVTSFSAINTLYLSATYPVILLFILLAAI